MKQRTPRQSMPSGWSWTTLLRDLVAAWRLLWDPSVPGLLKLALPFMALLYLISPLDLIPLMPFDDIVIMMLAARLFVALSPRESVDRAFGGNRNTARPGAFHQESGHEKGHEKGEVIDTTWRVIE